MKCDLCSGEATRDNPLVPEGNWRVHRNECLDDLHDLFNSSLEKAA